MPCGQACLRPALQDAVGARRQVSYFSDLRSWDATVLEKRAVTPAGQTYNSASRCCRFMEGRQLICAAVSDAILTATVL